MWSMDEILRLEAENAEIKLANKIEAARNKNRADLLGFGTQMIASMTTEIVMAGLTGTCRDNDARADIYQ